MNSVMVESVHENANVPPTTLDGQLTRQYVVATGVWSSDTAQDTTLAYLSLPLTILGQSFIADKIEDFRYLTCGFEIGLRINASQSLHGLLQLAWMPGSFLDKYATQYTTAIQQSGFQNITASASASTTITMKLPFVNRQRFFDILTGNPAENGVLDLKVLVPLFSTTGEVCQVQFFITVRLLEPKLYVPVSVFPTMRGRWRAMLTAFQAKKPLPDQVPACCEGTRVVMTEQDTTDFEKWTREMEKTSHKQAVKELKESHFKFLTLEKYENWFNKYFKSSSSSSSSSTLPPKYVRPRETFELVDFDDVQSTSEARAKASAGMVSDNLIVSKPTRNFVGKVIRTAVGYGLSAMAGLSKPTSIQTSGVGKIDPFAFWSSSDAVSFAEKICSDPENSIATMPNVMGHTEDEMAISHIVGTPAITQILTLSPTTVNVRVMTLSTEPGGSGFCYVDFIKRLFEYSSGSYKMGLYWCASMFHTAQFVLYLAADNVSNWQDCPFVIVQVQGDVVEVYKMPYLDNTFVRDSSTTAVAWSVYVSTLAWSQPDPAIYLPINLVVYKGACDDFEVGAQIDCQYTLTTSTALDDVQTTCDMRALFKGPAKDFYGEGYMQDRIVIGEKVKSLRECTHRIMPQGIVAAGNIDVWSYPSPDPVYRGHQVYGLLYAGYTGGFRMTCTPQSVYGGPTTQAITMNRPGYVNSNLVGAVFGSATNPNMEMEVPYYSSYCFEPNRRVASKLTIYNPNLCYLSRAMSDDFSWHWLVPPPPGTMSYAQNPTGMANWFANTKQRCLVTTT